MATLRADENRYLLFASPKERAALARIPGARFGPRGWQLPRQAAVILALDRVLGREGWSAEADLALEIAEARSRAYPPAESPAHVRVEGGLLSVECTIADKELVKQVPGYRWSPAQKRWYVAAMPLALDVLRDAFGERLVVEREVEELIALRRIDEEREAERSARASEERQSRDVMPPAPATTPLTEPELDYRELRQPPPGDRLEPLIERLIAAIEGLTARLDGLGAVPGVAAPPAAAGDEPAAGYDAPSGWQEILGRAANDPAEALDDARRRLQTTPDAEPELRAVTGIAAWRAGETDEAFKHLKKGLESGAPLQDADLNALARETYVSVVLALVSSDCGPVEPVSSVEGLRELLHRELSNDDGFDERVGAATVRGTLELLVTDRALRAASPALSDYCRILHLLATARQATRMPSELVADVLRDPGLGADAFALGCVLYACVLQGENSVSEWIGRWPGGEDEAPAEDAGWLVELALRRLGTASSELAGEAALAVLACIAAGSPEQATLAQRRSLVGYIAPGATGRRYAEFLAVYRLAAAGERLPIDSFPGYVGFMAEVPLQQSAPYLTEVYLTSEGSGASAVRALADGVFLQSLEKHGITDADQLIPLIDLLRAGTHPDNLLNGLGRLVEEGEFPGARMLDREQRIGIYRTAYEECTRIGHDRDTREAFFRLVRALELEPTPQPLVDLCNYALTSIKPIRLPAALTLLETLLGEGLPFEDALGQAIEQKRDAADEAYFVDQMSGLQLAYPALRDAVASKLAEKGEPADVSPAPTFEGERVLIVGGHQRLKARALPVLETSGLKAEWIDASEGKSGQQVINLVKGACELVVINTAYIGHSLSGRAEAEAKRAGKQVLHQPNTGLGSLLIALKRWREGEQTDGARKQGRVEGLRKLARR